MCGGGGLCAGGAASAQSLEDRFILPRYFHLRECRSGGRQLRARIRASYGCSIWISTSQSSQMSRFAPAQASTPYDPCCPLRLLHTADFASSVCSGRNATNFWRQVLFQSAYDARLSPPTAPSCVRYAFSHSFSPFSCTSNRVEVVDWSLNPVCGTALGFKPSAKARARGDVMQLVDTGDYTQQCGKMRPSILASRLLYSHSSLLRHQSKSALRPCLDLIVIVSWP